jgi:hypothetical protein
MSFVQREGATRRVGKLVSPLASVAAAPLVADSSPWWPSLVVGLVSLSGVVFVAVYNARATSKSEDRQRQLAQDTLDRQAESQQKLEDLRSALTEARDEATASREYKFEALKRLYSELDPLLFQLREQSEAALFRIYGLARSARTGKLGPEGTSKRENRLHEGSGSYLPSTLYRFMAPLASFRLCQQRFTAVDLSLDEGVRQQQYLLAKLLYRSWSDGDELAEISVGDAGCLRYDPDGESTDPAVFAQQHLSVQKIERIIEGAMIEHEGTPRCVTLSEFFDAYESKDNKQFHDAIEPLKKVFVSFNPGSRPVLWRLLMVHAYLYTGLSGRGSPIDTLDALFDVEELQRLSWADTTEGHDDAFAAARKYLTDQILWRSVATRHTAAPSDTPA